MNKTRPIFAIADRCAGAGLNSVPFLGFSYFDIESGATDPDMRARNKAGGGGGLLKAGPRPSRDFQQFFVQR